MRQEVHVQAEEQLYARVARAGVVRVSLQPVDDDRARGIPQHRRGLPARVARVRRARRPRLRARHSGADAHRLLREGTRVANDVAVGSELMLMEP